jgi:hypothetical protein
MERAMRKIMIPAISLVLLAGASLSSAVAAGPRTSDSNDWPGMSQPANSANYGSNYRPDAASRCGIYDSYCYYNGRLSLDNTERNR